MSPVAAQNATILFVDDEGNVLSALRRLFRHTSHRVLLASSGAQGLALLEKEHVDVVVSDMRMPEMDGAAFLGAVARRWPQTVRILLTGYADLESTIAALNEGLIFKHLSKPWNDDELRQAIDLALRQSSRVISSEPESALHKVQQDLALAQQTIDKNHTALLRVFTKLVDLREDSANGHSRRVAQWATRLDASLHTDKIHTQSLALAALFHDIVKIASPATPRSTGAPVRDDEHANIGHALLREFDFLQEVALWVRHHHEHFDGTGSPDGLRGESIPLGARILAVVNDYDDLLQGGLASRPVNELEARRYLHEHRGSRYDPAVVDAFLQLVGVCPEEQHN